MALATVLWLPAKAQAASACTGDCEGSNTVTVDEIITLANIALGNVDVDTCPAGDTNGDAHVTVDEIVAAVNNALRGCPPPPTAAASSTPEPTATPEVVAALDVGHASGSAGSFVAIDVTLSSGQGVVTAASNDIEYDASKVRVVQTEDRIGCAINPAIGPGTAVSKSLLLARFGSGEGMETVRVGLVGFTSAAAIPDGILYTCEFEIDAGVPPGEVILHNSPGAANRLGQRLNVVGEDGRISIE